MDPHKTSEPCVPNAAAVCADDARLRRETTIARMASLAAGLTLAVATAIACSPKPDPDQYVECQYACDAGKSNIQCELNIETHPLNKKFWEITCADIDDLAAVHLACEQACNDWDDGTSAYCIETVKKPSGDPTWEPYQCIETGYGGTEGLPPLDDDGTSVDGGDGADSTGSSAPAWEPGTYVTFNAMLDVYIIDQQLVDAVKAQPTLLALDGTEIVEMSSGGFEFDGITTDSLGDILGVANGDVPKSINGHRVATMEQAMDALAAIHDASSLTLKVERGGAIVTLDYLIR